MATQTEELYKKKKKKQIDISKLSESDQQRLKELKQQYEEVCEDVVKAYTTKKERIKEAAYILENQYKLEYPNEEEREKEIHNISSVLAERFKEYPSIRSDLSRYLDDRYKAWTYHKKESWNEKNVAFATFDEQTKEDFENIVDKIISNPYSSSRRNFQDIAQAASKIMDTVDKVEEETGIDFVKSRTIKISEKPVKDNNNRISLEPGDPVTNEENKILFKTWADKRREIGALEYKIADDIEKYPSNDPEIAKLGIKEAEARLRLLKDVPDGRVTADHEHWMKGMEKRRKDSSSGIPPGREWVTKYDLDVGNGKVEARNPMGKEQTDIRAPKVIRDFQFMFSSLGEKAIFKNRRASKHKKLQDRKKNVSPKQSDSA